MARLSVPLPCSVGIFLSCKCSGACKHCLSAYSPDLQADWLALEDAEIIMGRSVEIMAGGHRPDAPVGLNTGGRLTGGEPFLNYLELKQLVESLSGGHVSVTVRDPR